MKSQALSNISAMLAALFLFCSSGQKQDILTGEWECVGVEHNSPLFKNTLPSYRRGDITLTIMPDSSFSWINVREKTNLGGIYTVTGETIHFKPINDEEDISAKILLYKNTLKIITGDGFTFTFMKRKER